MIQDEEFELLVTTPERIEALGFKPQKEILTNHVLPYADELDEESKRFLHQVKTNLAKSVMLREMKPACGVWSSRLMKYLRIYGLKFGKEDHITLIKLAYEMVLIPDLEPCKIHKFATLFIMLTKKKHLVSPDELTLPWRPLYDVGKKIFAKSATSIGMYHYLTPDRPGKGSGMLDMIRKFISGNGLDDALNMFGLASLGDELPTSMEGSYMSMVKCARPYFELSATKEMLEEFLPQIQPWSTDTHIMGQMTVFLPVGLFPQHAAMGHELWFDQIMELWDTCYNSPCGISDLMTLFSGLAKRNPGNVDWSPYVPKMFTRFLHALNLPVNYKDMQYSKNHSLESAEDDDLNDMMRILLQSLTSVPDSKDIASWIVWTINPDGLTLKHLRCFVGAVESYLHSANAGRWSYRLRDLLRKLAREFLNRVRREREKRYQSSWENKTPDAYKLRDEDITDFVNIILEPTLQAVYSRAGSLDISIALQNLATLRPAIVVPPLLERLRTSLTSLTEPHRVTAAMSAVAAVARPMLRGADGDFPEGPTHVVPFLMAVLPGLDPNDIKKTLVTLHFILIFTWMVPYIDCSSAHEYWPDLTEEELLTCESTAQLEDFVLVFLDRLFTIIESSVMEHVRLDTKDTDCVRSKTDAVMETAISSAATAVLMQCSPKIFKEALKKFKAFANESTYETNVSGSMIGVLLKVFARIDSESTLAAFVPDLCEELNELLSTEEAIRDENPQRDLSYSLVLLMNAVECDGVVLLKYIPQIIPVLDKALKLHAKYSLIRACEILSHIFTSLCFVDLKEWRSSPKDYGTAPKDWLPVREWGRGCLLKEADFKWHVPNEDEAACAQMLVDRYLKPELTRLRQWLSGERDMCRERRLRCFYVINAVLSCSTFLPSPDEQPVTLMESLVPATSIPFTNGVKHTVTLDGQNLRVELIRLLLDVQARMLSDKTDDTRGLEMLIQVWERAVVMKGLRSGSGLEARLRSYGALERALDGRGGVAGDARGAAKLRTLVADGARLQDEARLDLVCDAGITPSALQALDALYELSINTYSSVRMLAQLRLSWMLSHYPYSYRALVPKLAELLRAGGEGDEWHARHKGALFIMLGPRTGPLIAKQDWEVVKTLWPAILKAPLSEKPSILRLEQAFSETLHRHFPTVNTRLVMSQSAVEVAKRLCSQAELTEPKLAELLAKAEARELANSDKIEKMYTELIDDLVDVAETPNVQWRRLELAMQMLTYCPSVQTPYTPRAVLLALRSLLHDDITVRRTAQRFAHFALQQRKRELKKIKVNPYEVAGMERPEKIVPGYRKDLEWAMWSGEKVPATDEEWDRPWLRNPNYGFYCWPNELEVAAPASQQQFSSDIPPEEMEEGERHIHQFFMDDANVDKLVSFLTVEEKKGKDKFSGVRFSMFKSLFSQFGPVITEKLLVHARRCAADSQEAPQRFASEIAAAALRAPRYWRRQQALMTYDSVLEVYSAGLTSVIPETMEDWGTSLATGVVKLEPVRGSGVLSRLLELCAPPASATQDPDQHTSFVVCARLYALQGALGSLRWQTAQLGFELLDRLEAANFIQHPYQNVRETVGSILMTIFDTELVFGGGAPRFAAFLAAVRPRLDPLYDENGDIVIKTAASMAAMAGPSHGGRARTPSPARPPRVDSAPDVPVACARLEPVDDTPQQENENVNDAGEPSENDRGERLDKTLSKQLDTALRLGGDSVAPDVRDHARAINLLTTVLRGSMGMIVRGVHGAIQCQYTLVGTACALAARGPSVPHDELARAADGFLASVALAANDAAAFNTALDTIETVAAGRSWWARLACLDFAQPLLFYGLPLLCDTPELAVRAETFTLKLMRDPRLEVRQAAAKLLTGLMHCGALRDEERTLRVLRRASRGAAPLERHAGVLGLCAYLASRPYRYRSWQHIVVQVRQAAAKLLTGLMHCGALRDEERTLRVLRRASRGAAPLERHAGVLGLCAYLASRPYRYRSWQHIVVQVRQAAAKLLTGLMHCGALRDEERTLRVLRRASRGAAPLERHAGVLGLCAYLASRPYRYRSWQHIVVQVRQAAAKLLTGLMHCGALRDEERTLRVLRRASRGAAPLERHAGVLGLCAYLASRPYRYRSWQHIVVQVRQAAAKLLTGLMHCGALRDEERTLRVLRRASRGAAPLERHAGVLGLCAYLASRPYRYRSWQHIVVQVRQAAAKLLTGLMHCGALRDEERTLRVLRRASRGAAPLERHAGVLGLCAYLASRPYRYRSWQHIVVQVRQAAAKLLTGLMHCGALRDEERTLRVLRRASRGAAPLERHAGVLGLCAYLASRPYRYRSWQHIVVQVRQAAAKLLTGLMHCGALRDEERTLRVLRRASRGAAPLERHAGVLGLCAYLASRPYRYRSWQHIVVQVRQAAAKLLTGLMHCGALRDEERTLRVLRRASRGAAPLERHAGVLGLCAYLASRPYSLGPQLGSVLAELARHTSAPDPVPAAIRAALADFRRTHQDEWPRHRDQLSQEELDLLADLTSPPSYCA